MFNCLLYQSSPSPPSCQAPLGQDPLCLGTLPGYKCAFWPPPLQCVQSKCSSLYSARKSKTGSFRRQRTLAPPPAPPDRNALDEGGIPKVCTDCGYFCQLLTLAITSLIGVEMNGLRLDLWALFPTFSDIEFSKYFLRYSQIIINKTFS